MNRDEEMKFWRCLFLCLWMGCPQTVCVIGSVIPTNAAPAPSSGPVTPTEDRSSELVDWLMKYGYLPPSDPSTGQLQAWTAVTHAVRAMQKFAGLKETGVIDEETMAVMKLPRCSLSDLEESPSQPAHQLQEGSSLRRKRAVSMWTRRNINWRLWSYPASSHLSRETIRSLVFYALRVWAEPTPLQFHEVAGAEVADLQVDFLHGDHGDGYPFDGAGGAVGHAFFPSDPNRAGGVHLDAEEEWAFRKPAAEGTDLFTVLVHELGHALGLSHSSARLSVMRPYYQGPAGDPLHYRLGPHDLERITQLYGKRNQLLSTDAPRLAPEPDLRHRGHGHQHRPGPSIDRCNTSFDAVAKIRGETFFFKGLSMWRVSSGGLVSGRGASVRRLWGALPADLPPLRAVLERQSDHGIIFISGSQFWLFRELSLQEGYPRPLSDLRMGASLVPAWGAEAGDEEEAAGRQGLVWEPDEGPVWGYMEEEEQQEGDTWTQLLRGGVNGITTDSNGSIFLFKEDSYWKFLFPGSTVEEGYPRSLATDWLDCSSSSSPVPDDLSLSPPTGRHELRENWREARGRAEKGEERGNHEKDRHGNRIRDREKERRRPQLSPCTCQDGAPRDGTSSFSVALLLALWTLLIM